MSKYVSKNAYPPQRITQRIHGAPPGDATDGGMVETVLDATGAVPRFFIGDLLPKDKSMLRMLSDWGSEDPRSHVRAQLLVTMSSPMVRKSPHNTKFDVGQTRVAKIALDYDSAPFSIHYILGRLAKLGFSQIRHVGNGILLLGDRSSDGSPINMEEEGALAHVVKKAHDAMVEDGDKLPLRHWGVALAVGEKLHFGRRPHLLIFTDKCDLALVDLANIWGGNAMVVGEIVEGREELSQMAEAFMGMDGIGASGEVGKEGRHGRADGKAICYEVHLQRYDIPEARLQSKMKA